MEALLVTYPAWAAIGLLTFFVGWPWLWHDSIARFRGYLGTGVDRASIQTLYFGQVYADRDVPWHYPWFYFAATVPLGLHLFGIVGLAKAKGKIRDDRFPLLLLGSMLLFLGVFSTNIPVYDGERLFLMVFPLWGVFIGLGFASLWERFAGKRFARIGLGGFLAAQAYGLILLHPFGLSYYNEAIGGLAGEKRHGLELTFWGDAVDRVLLDRLLLENRENRPSALVPTLYPGQGVATTTPAMARRELILGDQEAATTAAVLGRLATHSLLEPSDGGTTQTRQTDLRPFAARRLAVGDFRGSRLRRGSPYIVVRGFLSTPRGF